MISHIVLFRFRPDARADQIERVGEALSAMHGRIPEIRRVSFGPNLGPTAAEFSHVLVVTLDDMDAVQRYLDHPVHRAVSADHINPIRAARLAVDVEVG